MNRRGFLAVIVAGVGFWVFTPFYKIRALYNRLKRPAIPDTNEIKIASRIAEYIYPEDDTPGALLLGIENFFINQFGIPYYQHHIPAVQRITRYLDRKCKKEHACKFLTADSHIQNQLIKTITSAETIQQYPEIQRDFNTLVDITLEGCFSDPTHGGNREKRAWQLLNGTINEEWFNV